MNPTSRRLRFAPGIMTLVALAVAVVLLAPYRSVSFTRADGVEVRVPPPERLSHVSDVWDYLQQGRQLQRGEGYTTLFTYVPFLPESRSGAPFPQYWRQPGYSTLVAGAFVLAGGPDPDAALVLQGLAVLLLAWGAYVLGRAVLSPGWAWLAAFWTVLSPLVLGVNEPLVSTTLYAACLAFLFAAVLRSRGLRGAALTGAMLGAVYLLRQETLLLLPAFLVARWLSREPATGEPGRGRRFLMEAVTAGAVALVVVSPWLIRAWRLTGSPAYNATSLLFHDTEAFPGWTASRTLEILDYTTLGFLRAHPGEVAAKAFHNLLRLGRDGLLLAGLVFIPFFWLGLLRPPRRPRARGFAAGTLLAGTTLVLVLAPMEYAPRFLAPLVPWSLVAAAVTLADLVGGSFPLIPARPPRFWRGVAILLSLFAAGNFATALLQREGPGTAATALAGLDRARELAPEVPWEETVLLTDAPTVYAWVWDRPAVWAPVPGDLGAVENYLGSVTVVLTCAAGQGDGLPPDLRDTYAGSGALLTREPCPTVLLPGTCNRPGVEP